RDGDDVTVHLADDHPGFHDQEYRSRRNDIAAAAMDWSPGDLLPVIPYTDQEQEVWQVVAAELAAKHRRLAPSELIESGERLGLPKDHIPQLDEVNDLLAPHTGFRYQPAAGLVPLKDFYGSLADRNFWSTQYIRHSSRPLYTPEPDVIHEVIGHATTLASPRLAAIYEQAGQAARRCEAKEALEFVSKVFWFSLEFGVLREDGEPKAYGAGLLSSYGEIEEFTHADLRPLDIAAMGTQTYDITHYQPILFCGDSLTHVEDVVGAFFTSVDDEYFERADLQLTR
ncbi:MAG: phenylalanine 4-monooxygenase, partial [Candidatus Nanopelagicales bacterium]